MAGIVQKVVGSYNALFIDKRDVRVDGWLFMSSPFPTLALCLLYVCIVKIAGPRFMKGREAYQLRGVLIVYNAFQVLFSLWIFIEFGMGGWFRGYSYRCQPVDYSQSEIAVRMTHAAWWYYFSKFIEFFDTFFFILRRKFEHVSTLHVVHHGIMPMSVWFGVKFTPGGHSTFFGLCNTLVHIVMYFYYMMAAMGPKYAKYLWWKRYLTSLQMVQFVCIFVHAFQLCFTDCSYPRAFMWWIGGHAVLFFFLFSDFYKRSYLKRREGKAAPRLSSIVPCIIQEHDTKTSNGYTNGYIPNGNAKNRKNQSNGHANGLSNGHSVISNGHTKNIKDNANGYVSNGVIPKEDKNLTKKRD